MNIEYYENASAISLKLHVSGFPQHVSNRSILKYFSKFGNIYIDESSFYTQGYRSWDQEQFKVPTSHKRKNYLVIDCADPDTRNAILTFVHHKYKGCSIFCNEYKTGQDLIQHNLKINQRRCILRKVPISYSREEVVSSVEQLAGRIESLFVYEPMKNHQVVRHYSVSITFYNSESLGILLSHAEYGVYFNSQRITVEKYGCKGKFDGEKLMPLRSTNPSLILSDEGRHLRSNEYTPIRTLPKNVPNLGLIPNHSSIHEIRPSTYKYYLCAIYRLNHDHSDANIRLNIA